MDRRDIEIVGLSGDPVRVDIAETGDGTQFVFLHGLVGLNEHWETVVGLVKHRVRCTMIEVPLLQLTGKDCSIDGVVYLTAKLLQSVSDSPVVLVGNSFGGHVATRLAIEYPELVQGLLLTGASGVIEKSMVSDIQIHPSREWLRRKIAELFYRPELHMRESDLDRAHQELSTKLGRFAMVRLSRSARRNHLGDQLSRVRVPTLLIWGKQDVVTPPDAAQQFHDRLQDSKLVWFDECGHVPMMEHAEAFAREMLAFEETLRSNESMAHSR
ncbi:MAG: alpha/beta hydrolase [Phycisphaeraceae bacterium]|nr:alpha/beta hydrolase [Phycisphaerales bacterium]MCB9860986.1 alpha/beta hydrolase [Phycisphaeraceae bacterium]